MVPFEYRTIRNPNFKTFGNRMDSEFECSVFEPPLYLKRHLKSQKTTHTHFFEIQRVAKHLFCILLYPLELSNSWMVCYSDGDLNNRPFYYHTGLDHWNTGLETIFCLAFTFAHKDCAQVCANLKQEPCIPAQIHTLIYKNDPMSI